jgi:hypothetical protein
LLEAANTTRSQKRSGGNLSTSKRRPRREYSVNRKTRLCVCRRLNTAMNYDDSATVKARGTPDLFKCLMCGRCMRDAGERWECRCGSFYKPLIPGTIPKKYRKAAIAIKRLCQDCGKVEVTGIRRLCPTCANSPKRESYRRSKSKSRSRVQKTGFSPVGAEGLTNAV